jgi:hypothetical protein
MKLIRVLLVVYVALLSIPNAWGQEIQWNIVNPYPFFKDDGDWDRLKPRDGDTFERWTNTLQTAAEASTKAGTAHWPSSDKTQWDEGYSSGKFYRKKDDRPKAFREGYFDAALNVVVRLSGAIPDGDCTWQTPRETKLCNEVLNFAIQPETNTIVAVTLPDGRRLEQVIRIEREIILAMGDSFSSGEGNPDRPTRFCRQGKGDICAPYNLSKEKGVDWFAAATKSGIREADWLDNQCNRSLYSYQNLVAMWRASRDPHKAVYLVPLACSGAEIKDGIIDAQSDPPGGNEPETLAQYVMAEKTLVCESGVCKYPPNIILLSIGGNDAYFAPLLIANLTPKSGYSILGSMGMSVVRRLGGMSDGLPGSANNRLTRPEEIQQEISGMLGTFKSNLTARHPKLVVTGYPDLLHRENGEWCSLACTPETPYSGRDWRNPDWARYPDLQCRSSMNHALNHVPFLPSRRATRDWEFRLTGDPSPNAYSKQFEQEVLERDIIRELNPRLEMAYRNSPHFGTVDFAWVNPPSEVSVHGICAVANPSAPRAELEWPWAKANGQWLGGLSPFEWNAYARRPRWFRTPNDVYQTQISKIGGPQGAFHPTAEYHEAFAREVVDALERQ